MRPSGASSTKAKGGFVMCAPLILVRFPPAQEINFLFALSECIFYYGTQDLSTGTKPSPSEVKPLQVVVGSFFLKKGVEGRNEPPFGAQAIQAKNAFLQQLWRDEAVKFSNGGVGEHAGQAVLSPPAAMQLYDGIQECGKRFYRGDFELRISDPLQPVARISQIPELPVRNDVTESLPGSCKTEHRACIMHFYNPRQTWCWSAQQSRGGRQVGKIDYIPVRSFFLDLPPNHRQRLVGK